jgi:Cu+-exporting ATPase
MAELLPGLAVNGLLLFLLSFPVQFYVGHQFHAKAWKTLKTGALGMDFLISTGTLAAYIYSTFGLILGILEGVPNTKDVEYFETSAVLITAVLLGKYLEVYARGQTAAAIHKLSKLKAHTARLVASGTGMMQSARTADQVPLPQASNEEESQLVSREDQVIDATLLHRRDVVRLVAGETVPADGLLLSGGSVGVDEAMMTVRPKSAAVLCL